MFKRVFVYTLGILIVLYIFFGPILFKKFWVDYRESYEPRKKDGQWEGVITLWDYPRHDTINGNSHNWINQKIKEFEKKHPKVYIEYRAMEEEKDNTRLKAALKIGAHPDIAPIGSDFYFISSGLMEALDEYIKVDERGDFIERALDACTYNNVLYGIPWARKAYTLILNTDIFEDAELEIPANGQWTYDEFLDSLKRIKDKADKDKSDIYALTACMNYGHYNVFGILLGDGADIIDEVTNEYCFYSSEALSGLKKLYELVNIHGILYPEIGNITQKQAFNRFLSGKSGVFLGDAWMLPYLSNQGSNHDINFTTAYYPIADAGYPIYMNDIYYSYGIFKQDDMAKKEMCIEFIKFLTSEGFQNDLVNFGYFPVRKSRYDIYQNDKEMYTIQKGLEYAKNIPRHKKWWEIYGALQYNIIEAINEAKGIEEALEDARKQIESIVQ